MFPSYYEFYCPVKILSGHKALAHLPHELELLGVSRALVVTDAGVVGAGLLKVVQAAMRGAKSVIAAVYDETPPDSSSDAVNTGARLFRAERCDGIVALGGGSAMDTAKAINIVVSENAEDLMAYQGADRFTKTFRPLVAIPTTSGTGSEVTLVSVVKNSKLGVKMPFTSDRLYPNVAILDPRMTLTMPPKITAATGMDALTHAVEAFYCLQKNPVSDAFAVSAIRLIVEYLPRAVEHGDDEEARLAVANAAMLAGIAFSNAMVGVVHALAHATGAVCHVPHGVANNIFLPFGLEQNLGRVASLIGELAGPLGVSPIPARDIDRAYASIEAIRRLSRRLHGACGLPYRLRDANVAEAKLPDIARAAINDGSVTYNPEDLTVDEALAILKRAY